jgi:hypothetical protein
MSVQKMLLVRRPDSGGMGDFTFFDKQKEQPV